MKLKVYSCLFLLVIFCFLSGCAPVRDAAGRISDDFGEVSDDLGKERKIGEGEDTVIIHPQADKKIKMSF